MKYISNNGSGKWIICLSILLAATFYHYRDLSKTTTEANPSEQTDVSNVVAYVKYIAK